MLASITTFYSPGDLNPKKNAKAESRTKGTPKETR